MDVRPYRDADAPAVAGLLASATGQSGARRYLWDMHGPDQEAPYRRTLVATDPTGVVTGTGSVFRSRRHPDGVFSAIHVSPERRRRGVGTALLTALADQAPGLRFRVRTHTDDTEGRAFLSARGFRPVVGCRTGTLTATDDEALSAVSDLAAGRSAQPAGDLTDELVMLLDRWYEQTHRWDPPARWSLDAAREHFGRQHVLPGSAAVVREPDGRLAGVANLLEEPWSDDGALLLCRLTAAPVFRPDAVEIVAALAVHCIAHAAALERPVTIEVDDPNPPFWTVAHALPVRWNPDLHVYTGDPTEASTDA